MAASLSPKAPRSRGILAALLLIGLCWLPSTPALAQSIPGVTAPAPAEQATNDVEALIKALDDPAAREQLKDQLELLLQAQRGTQDGSTEGVESRGIGARLLSSISDHVESVSNTLVDLVEAIADMPQRAEEASRLLQDPVRRAYWSAVAIDLAGVLATAFIAAWAGRRLLARARARLARQAPLKWPIRLLLLPVIFLVEVLPAVAFAIAAFVGSQVFTPNEHGRLIISAIVTAQVATMLAAAAGMALLAAQAPGLRIFRMSDETAAYLQVWVRRLSAVAFYGYAILQLAAVIGVDPALREVIARLWGLLLAAMLVILILQNRVAVAQRIAGRPIADPSDPAPADEPLVTPLPEPDEPSGRRLRFGVLRGQLAKIWHILAIGYIAAAYLVWSFRIEGGFGFLFRATVLTGILFVVVRLASRFLVHVFDHSFALSEDIKRILPGLENRANKYLPLLKRALLAVLYVAALFALLQVWGLDVIGWLSDGSGRPVMAAIIKIVVILVLAALLTEFINMAIEHYLRETDGQGRPLQHSPRMRTLLPLLRNAFRITLGVMVVMVVLSEIGLDIGPLLAAAGVVGLAIGFGAQTLVKDIITGVFILMEDTLSIGDVVDLGGHAGVVEGMTIRTIRLRDQAGTVHTVPFSAVATVQNMTKDFSFAVFEIGVAYKENVRKVIEVIKQVGNDIENDPALRYNILAPIEILGLDAFQDSAIVIKARIKTRPITQWTVMRAFNLRLKEVFDEKEIEIPFPQRTLHVTPAQGAALAGGKAAPAPAQVSDDGAGPRPDPEPGD